MRIEFDWIFGDLVIFREFVVINLFFIIFCNFTVFATIGSLFLVKLTELLIDLGLIWGCLKLMKVKMILILFLSIISNLDMNSLLIDLF